MSEPNWNPLKWRDGLHWVNDYVDDVMRDALSSHTQTRTGSLPKVLPAELFQTHHYVIVRFRVPSSVNEQHLRAFASRQRVKIEGLPNGESQYVSLPAPVFPETCKALYKDQILQIKLLKRKTEEHFEEIYIRYR